MKTYIGPAVILIALLIFFFSQCSIPWPFGKISGLTPEAQKIVDEKEKLITAKDAENRKLEQRRQKVQVEADAWRDKSFKTETKWKALADQLAQIKDLPMAMNYEQAVIMGKEMGWLK